MNKKIITQFAMANSKHYTNIYITNHYEMFGFLTGNRQLDPTNLKKITESFKKEQIFESTIIVAIDELATNGEWLKIIDGQHRFEVAKTLGLDFTYVIMGTVDYSTDNLTIVETLNTANKEWDVTNFLISKTTLNDENYTRYYNVYFKYPQVFEHEIIFYIYNKINGKKCINHNDFKKGLLKFTNEDEASILNIFAKLKTYIPKVSELGKRYYLKALIDIIFTNEVDIKRLDSIMMNETVSLPFTKTVDYALEYIIKNHYNKGVRKNQLYMFSSGKKTILEVK